MPIKIDSINILQEYLIGVLGRAGHHANQVEGVALSLLGAIIWKSDGEITVRQYNDRPANMIWFQVNGTPYMMKYNHKTGKIELINRDTNVVANSFDNNISHMQVITAFNNL